MEIQELLDEILAFRDERDWAQFHTPKQLAAAIAIEASELQELFLWRDDNEVVAVMEESETKRKAHYEIADILIFALRFCDAKGANPVEAVLRKLEMNRQRYPRDLSKGRFENYDKLDPSLNSQDEC